VIVLSWLMVVQVVISQGCVWAAILTERLQLYYYEELGWILIFAANTIASAYLYSAVGVHRDSKVLLELNLLFGVLYLPWQVIHLTSLRARARKDIRRTEPDSSRIAKRLLIGLNRAVRLKRRRTDADSWGGPIGLSWMIGYWATLIPAWVYYIVVALSPH
jgi:hypothetical protein